MRIPDSLLDLMISKCRIDYNGTHNSDRKNPLWGRAAYWRVYLADGTYVAKVTTPVKSISPKPSTLEKLFRNEIRSRFNSIGEVVTTTHYGQVQVEYHDPCSIKRMLKSIEGVYVR